MSIRFEAGFAFSNPAQLPITGFIQPGGPPNFHITPNGQHFLMVFPPGMSPTTSRDAQQIHVVLNWFEELKQKMSNR